MKKWIVLGILIILCGCTAQGGFTLTDLTFCDGEPGDRSYIENPDATYTQGETVWMYLEGLGFLTEEKDNKFVGSFDVELELFDDQGTSLGEFSQLLEEPSDEEPDYVWFKFWVDSSTLVAGMYTVRITVTDRLSGETASVEGTFKIVE